MGPPPTSMPSEDVRPRCAPDRPYIAYQHEPLTSADTLVGGLYVTHLDSTGSRLVLPAYCSGYDWIPGTDTLLVSMASGVYLLSASTGATTPVSTFGGAYNTSVSPDGSLIAFDSDLDGRSALFLFSRANGMTMSITPDSMVYGSPAWSPDGTELLTIGGSPHINGILRIDLAGAPIKRVSTATAPRSPAWSPRGDRVAWVEALASHQVWVADTTGTSRRYVVAGWDGVTWTPDGQGIVYNAPTPNGVKLFHFDFTTGSSRQITF